MFRFSKLARFPGPSRRLHKRQQGFSLAAVMTTGFVTSMWLMALFAILVPTYQKAAGLRTSSTVRSLCEGGLDYVLDQLNSSLAAGVASPYDSGAALGQIKDTVLPYSVTNNANATVTVRVETVSPPNTSLLYDATILPPAGIGYYRRVTATSTYGAVTRNVRVVLQPTYGTPTSDTNVELPWAAFGSQRVELVGRAGINSFHTDDPRLYCDIGTLGAGNQVGTGSTSRGIAQGGMQFEFPNPVSYQSAQIQETCTTWNATPTAVAPWCHIMGNVYSNGDTTGYWPRGPSATSAQNYLNTFGSGNGLKSGIPDGLGKTSYVPVASPATWSGGIVNSYATYPQPSIPPSPSAPPGTASLGSINIQGNGQLIFDQNASGSVSSLGTIGNNQTVTIKPGDYMVNTISITGTGSIVFKSNVSTNTRLFLQGPSSGSNVVSLGNTTNVNMLNENNAGISGSGFNNTGNNGFPGSAAADQISVTPTSSITESAGSARQLQLYYQGTQPMYMMGNARLVAYAPNSTINVGAQPVANDAHLYGALVGAVVRIISDFYSAGGAYLHYDANLKPSGSLFINPSQPPKVMSVTPVLTGYRAVTWQEARLPSSTPAQITW